MKNFSKMSAALAVATLVFGAGSALAAPLAAGTYKIDPSHSKVGFEISHLVISTVEGRFGTFEGSVVAGDKFDKTQFEAKVQIGSIDTSEKKRDEHLKSPEFFDAAKFPTMTFKSTAIKGSPESFKLEGDLTIKGITKKVAFDAKYAGSVTDPWGNVRAAFSAKTKISRKAFGLTWNKLIESGPVVGDEVTIDLKAETIKEGAAKAPAKK